MVCKSTPRSAETKWFHIHSQTFPLVRGFCGTQARPVRSEQLPSYQQDCLAGEDGGGDKVHFMLRGVIGGGGAVEAESFGIN